MIVLMIGGKIAPTVRERQLDTWYGCVRHITDRATQVVRHLRTFVLVVNDDKNRGSDALITSALRRGDGGRTRLFH